MSKVGQLRKMLDTVCSSELCGISGCKNSWVDNVKRAIDEDRCNYYQINFAQGDGIVPDYLEKRGYIRILFSENVLHGHILGR